jgi:hypothetical protein
MAHGGRLVVPLRLSDEPDQLHAVSALVKVDDGFDSIAVTPGGFMPLRRTDGTAFCPVAPTPPAEAGAEPEPAAEAGPAPTGTPATARRHRPLHDASREQMASVRIAVRYTAARPRTRWAFDRGDHWIGVDLSG